MPKPSDSKPCKECKGPITRGLLRRTNNNDVTAFARRKYCGNRCRLTAQKRARQILGL